MASLCLIIRMVLINWWDGLHSVVLIFFALSLLLLSWTESRLSSLPCARTFLLIDHFTYYCLGSQGGKLWVVMRLLGPIACRKLTEKYAETLQRSRRTTGLSFWIVGLQFQLFLQTIGLDAATSSPLTGLRSIVLPLELNERVRPRRRSSLPSQTLVLPLQLPSRKARQVREELAEAGKQIEEHKKREEEMERLLASSNVRMPAQKLRSLILSFENVKGNDD